MDKGNSGDPANLNSGAFGGPAGVEGTHSEGTIDLNTNNFAAPNPKQESFDNTAMTTQGLQVVPRTLGQNALNHVRNPLERARMTSPEGTVPATPVEESARTASTRGGSNLTDIMTQIGETEANSSVASNTAANNPMVGNSTEFAPVLGENYNNQPAVQSTNGELLLATDSNVVPTETPKITKKGLNESGLAIIGSISANLDRNKDPAGFYDEVERIKRNALRSSFSNRRNYLQDDEFERTLKEAGVCPRS